MVTDKLKFSVAFEEPLSFPGLELKMGGCDSVLRASFEVCFFSLTGIIPAVVFRSSTLA